MSIKIYSPRVPFKNALFMSSSKIRKKKFKGNFWKGEKVSWKPIPNCWEKPPATSLALCLESIPSKINLNNHLQLMGF